MRIKGKYKITINCKDYEIVRYGENLITLLGQSYFLNRWKDNTLEPIGRLCFGKSSRAPDKQDQDLGNQTYQVQPKMSVNLLENSLNMSATLNPEQLIGVCEIGVKTGDDLLISRDVFKPFTADILGASSSINIDYQYVIETGDVHSDWTPYTQKQGVYYTSTKNIVTGVSDENGNGYIKKDSIDELTQAGTYYYSNTAQKVYINPIGEIGKIIIKE